MINQEKDRDAPVLATSMNMKTLSTMEAPVVTLPRPQMTITKPQIEHKLPPTLSSDLSSKLAGDVVVACTITFGVAPFMTVIDKAIVQRAAGTHGILQSGLESVTNIARNPASYVKSPMFLMMWGVYAATYTTANCLKTIAEHQEHFQTRNTNDADTSSAGMGTFGVFAATTIVNSATSMFKDKFYAKQFGLSTAAAKIPKITYGLWGMRDCMVIGSSFILPDIMCGMLQEHSDLDKATALRVSQFACPIAAQFVTGPVQLLGLDIYNRPLSNLSFKELAMTRLRFQYQNYASIVGARISRIAPAYGVGGIGNTYLRDKWRDRLLQKEFA